MKRFKKRDIFEDPPKAQPTSVQQDAFDQMCPGEWITSAEAGATTATMRRLVTLGLVESKADPSGDLLYMKRRRG